MILRVKEILKAKGITQVELSEILEVSKIGVNRIINGNPTVETLQKIATALDVDVKDLFVSTKQGEKIQVIINDELITFSSVEDFKTFANSL